MHQVGRKQNAQAFHVKVLYRNKNYPRHYPVRCHALPDLRSPVGTIL